MGSTPQISPTSFPTFSGLLTPTPTSSNDGCGTIWGITSFPTNPVPQTTTRLVTAPAPLRSAHQFARVHHQVLAGDRLGVVGREEHRHVGDLAVLGHASERKVADDVVEGLFRRDPLLLGRPLDAHLHRRAPHP